MNTMRYLKSARPESCAPSVAESSRYSLHGVAAIAQGDRTFLAATDGHCLTLVRAYPEEGDRGYVGMVYPSAAFTSARKATPKKVEETTLRLNGSAVVKAGDATTEYAKIDGTFPDVFACFPKGAPVARITINAELLAKMQAAFGSDGVTLDIYDECEPVLVRPVELVKGGYSPFSCGSQGVLMPIGL